MDSHKVQTRKLTIGEKFKYGWNHFWHSLRHMKLTTIVTVILLTAWLPCPSCPSSTSSATPSSP